MDWKLIIKEIQDCGWTQVEIASICNCSQAAVSAILTGKRGNPSYATGQAFIALLRKAKRNPRKEAVA